MLSHVDLGNFPGILLDDCFIGCVVVILESRQKRSCFCAFFGGVKTEKNEKNKLGSQRYFTAVLLVTVIIRPPFNILRKQQVMIFRCCYIK